MISVALYGLAMLALGYLIAWTIHAPQAKEVTK